MLLGTENIINARRGLGRLRQRGSQVQTTKWRKRVGIEPNKWVLWGHSGTENKGLVAVGVPPCPIS